MKTTPETSVRLLSWTANPIETIYAEWCASRPFMGPVISPDLARSRIRAERCQAAWNARGPQSEVASAFPVFDDDELSRVEPGKFETEVRKVFEEVISAKIPVAETIDFVFLIENCPIALREQMVRHRIGHKFGQQIGVDTIPDIAESTWWGQTMRVQDMGRFAADGHYLTPEWLKENGDKPMPGYKAVLVCPIPGCDTGIVRHNASLEQGESWECGMGHMGKGKPAEKHNGTISEFYHEQMGWIQSAYNRLVKAGMPTEDARNLLPLGCSSDNIWKMNLSALMHVLSKRGCWIAQLGMWEPVIRGLVNELATKIDPYFRNLINPPCIGPDDRFNTCVFKVENQNRLPGGADPYPPCPLWTCNDFAHEKGLGAGLAIDRAVGPDRGAEFNERSQRYAELWGRDPITGDRVRLG